jgi:hypothetical protein
MACVNRKEKREKKTTTAATFRLMLFASRRESCGRRTFRHEYFENGDVNGKKEQGCESQQSRI